MSRFLDQIAEEVLKMVATSRDPLVVFQSRRAGLYFKHIFAAKTTSTLRMPQVMTIEEFASLLCPFRVLDPVDLLFEFYQVYQQTGGTDSFSAFAGWAPILLNDFDDIDAYLAPPEEILNHVKNLQSMNAWEPGSESTPRQKRYLEFWAEIPTWYSALRQRLESQHMAYKGLLFRLAAETIQDHLQGFSNTPIVFAGFNALTAAEETLFKALVKEKLATVYWDMDRYYVETRYREAGHFIRKYQKTWARSMQWQGNELETAPKTVEIIGVAQRIGQVRMAVQLLSAFSSYESTAIVLADESLLMPLLHHLPESLGAFNVSMGLRLGQSNLAEFIKTIFELHLHSKDGLYYHEDVQSLMDNPYFLDLTTDQKSVFELKRKMLAENLVWVQPQLLANLIGTDKNTFVRLPWTTAADVLQSLREMVDELRNVFITNRSPIEIENLFQFSLLHQRLEAMIKNHGVNVELSFLCELLIEMMRSIRVPFSGEPLVGLQIMGILETRSLDFENVIVLGMNENILPLGKTRPSLIPFEVRRWAHLPTHTERDAIYAYNFYRLIQRARRVSLIYNTQTDEFGRGEVSRFVTQLVHELPQINSSAAIIDRLVTTPLGPGRREQAIVIEKDSLVMAQLDRLAERGLSPTGIREFIRCPLRFFFKYVAGLKEQEEIEETAEVNTVGNIVHHVLESMYNELRGKKLSTEWILEKQRLSRSSLKDAFGLHHIPSIDSGKNHIIFELASETMEWFWKAELNRISSSGSIHIEAVEHEVSTALELSINGQPKSVNIKGRMDRIEREKGLHRIIDYKTGTPGELELPVGGLPALIEDHKYGVLLQLMTYALAYGRSNEFNTLLPSIYWLRRNPVELKNIANQAAKTDYMVREEQLIEFGEVLKKLLSDLFDPAKPFQQTPDLQHCNYCEFTTICNRRTKELKD